MNRKTFLSMYFPNFVAKWNKYYHNLKKTDYWCISSDYCLDNKDKPHDVMTFTIFPFDIPSFIREDIKKHLHKDIKEFQILSDDAIEYIKNCPYFFSIALIIDNKNNFFDVEKSKISLEHLIKIIEKWPENKRKEFIHPIKKLRHYLNQKYINQKLLSSISIIVQMLSVIIEFLLLKTNMKHVIWISDRDDITTFLNNNIVHYLIRLGYAYLIKNRVPDNKVYGIFSDKEYNKEILDYFIRIPDYISGALSSMKFDDIDSISDKHYKLFDKSIVDNEKIYIMNLDVSNDSYILGNTNFIREENN